MAKRASNKKVAAGRASQKRDASWQLQDAKARFSEVVRRARTIGPQYVTVRGEDGVVVVSAEEMRRLTKKPAKKNGLVALMESLPDISSVDLTREDDRGRDVDL